MVNKFETDQPPLTYSYITNNMFNSIQFSIINLEDYIKVYITQDPICMLELSNSHFNLYKVANLITEI